MAAPELAPNGCIVCKKPHPGGENVPGWTYLAGAKPLGALACSPQCTLEALQRFQKTGRCDAAGAA
jgi:predicted nucleic acid-binding Zn ribbon protein